MVGTLVLLVAVGPALSDAFLAPISDPIGLTGLFITHRLVVFSRFGLVWDLGKRFTIDGSSKQLFTTHHDFQGSHFAKIQDAHTSRLKQEVGPCKHESR